MSGVEILSVEQVAVAWDYNWTAFWISLIGFFIGRTFKNFNPRILEIIGGSILIFMAIKVIL